MTVTNGREALERLTAYQITWQENDPGRYTRERPIPVAPDGR